MNIGDKWNNWTIDELLGEGQFGKVYRLVRTGFVRRYEAALKVIRIPQDEAEYRSIKSENTSEEAIANYYRSVIEQIIDECSVKYDFKGSGHIVSYEGYSVEKIKDGFGWEICIQMELLTPLVRYLRDHPATEQDVIRMGIDICKALEICQKHNIIYRDIKPENIFVSKQGDFKLGEFGIARCMENATTVVSRIGAATHLAPEIYKERPYNSTVDIYSLGLLMYRLMNHYRMPFLPAYPQQITFKDKDRAMQLRMESALLPLPDQASEELAAIILRACALDPDKRYATASEMRLALENIL